MRYVLQTDVVYHSLHNNCLTESGSQLSEKIRATEKEGWVLSSTGPDEREGQCVCVEGWMLYLGLRL